MSGILILLNYYKMITIYNNYNMKQNTAAMTMSTLPLFQRMPY